METPLQDKMLEVLRTHGGWLTRSEIAKLIGRDNGVQPYDAVALQALADAGCIEIQEIPYGVTRKTYQYRARQTA